MINSWKEMNIGTFIKYSQIIKAQYSEDELVLRAAALIGGITYDDILEMPLSKARKYTDATDFLRKQPEVQFVNRTYTLGGNKYRLTKKMKDVTTAQYIDFESYAHSLEDNIDKIMSVVLIPEGHTYGKDYDLEDVQKDVREHMNVEEAFSIANFFISSYQRSIHSTLIYFRLMVSVMRTKTAEEKRIKEAMKEVIKNLEEISTHWFIWQ